MEKHNTIKEVWWPLLLWIRIFLYLFINTGPDCILTWTACSNPELVGEQLPVTVCHSHFPASPRRNALKGPERHPYIGGDWTGRGKRILCLNDSMSLTGWAGLHVPTVPHPNAGAEPGPEAEQICTIAVRWMLSGEGPVSPERSAWIMKKVYEKPTFCNTSSPLKPSVNFQT